MLAWSESGEGPPLVLLHGLGSSRRRWDPLVERLTGFRCVAVDLPGHGDSPDEGCDVASAAVAVGALLRELRLDRPPVIGHSLGANVALLVAAGSGAGRVVAIDPTPLQLPVLSRSLAPYADRLRAGDFARAFGEWEHERFGFVPSAEQLVPRREVVLRYWARLLDPAAAEESQPLFEAALSAVHVPVVLCVPEPLSPGDALVVSRMPTTVVEVVDGGHFPHLVDPEGFAVRLRQWLGQEA